MLNAKKVNHPGIPGNNFWFTNRVEALQAARQTLRRMGPGYRIAHHAQPQVGPPHYHLIDPQGNPFCGHFFYRQTADQEVLHEGHGATYKRERQKFFQRLLKKRRLRQNLPRYVRGWLTQEKRRRQQVWKARQQQQKRPLSGTTTTATRRAKWQAIWQDTTQPEKARKFAQKQIRRLDRGQKPRRRVPDIRGVPGLDVSHVDARYDDWRNFRLEDASTNRARPGIAKRLGLGAQHYESKG